MITYEQAAKLVYLGVRLMIVYKLISVVLYLPATIPTIILSFSEAVLTSSLRKARYLRPEP